MNIKTRTLIACLAFGLVALANAETPNIEPGLWEYSTRMTVEGDFPFPEQNDTTTECVTAEDIAEADAFMGDMDMDECEVTREEVRADGANYEMTCVEQGMSMEMNMEMTFMGDRSEGLIISHAETPMGAMKSTIEMSGRRIGDCD